ncbi:hypothetical protein BO99DRAFT_437871 [Aspergillus violaceofuscus CBS 115571]|uniref:Uncharacterized protein n=1 Tax=Aspergillus violaceofuscus (strain CBS 115571) TaxID=1450538 RepID=A0A2V5I2H6_ASPV1|nr:hypothetical protein BO99DRAFT_437871 [Aspergillus violaceofuscus CBS 115571]
MACMYASVGVFAAAILGPNQSRSPVPSARLDNRRCQSPVIVSRVTAAQDGFEVFLGHSGQAFAPKQGARVLLHVLSLALALATLTIFAHAAWADHGLFSGRRHMMFHAMRLLSVGEFGGQRAERIADWLAEVGVPKLFEIGILEGGRPLQDRSKILGVPQHARRGLTYD